MDENKITKLTEKVKSRLLKIDRKGIPELVEYMTEKGFFTSPASTKYHGNYDGGLLTHCTKFYNLLKKMHEMFNLPFDQDSMLICVYGHDLCKMGAYYKINAGGGSYYKWNGDHPKGHSILSIKILEKFIKLTELEKNLITYHMGMYGTKECSDWSGEYNILKLADMFSKEKLCKLFYFCDDMSSNFLEE